MSETVLFLGIELPDEIKSCLASLRPQKSPGVRPIRPENLHITLHYLGKQNQSAVEAAVTSCLSLLSQRPFELVLKGLGQFGRTSKPSVLWQGVESNSDLLALHQQLLPVINRLDVEPDHHKYHPHITLARCRWNQAPTESDQRSLMSFHQQQQKAIHFQVKAFVLFESRIGSAGREYPIVSKFDLKN